MFIPPITSVGQNPKPKCSTVNFLPSSIYTVPCEVTIFHCRQRIRSPQPNLTGPEKERALVKESAFTLQLPGNVRDLRDQSVFAQKRL